MEARYKSGKPVSVTDFRREIAFLKSAGKLPSLEEILAAVAEAKATYQRRLKERGSDQMNKLTKPGKPESDHDRFVQGMFAWSIGGTSGMSLLCLKPICINPSLNVFRN